MAKFIQPLIESYEGGAATNAAAWVNNLTVSLEKNFSKPEQAKSRVIDPAVSTYNSNRVRISFEQLIIHPVRISLTFTQEWLDPIEGTDTLLLFHFIRGMVRLSVSHM